MTYRGAFTPASLIPIPFNTVREDTGVAIVFAGTPVIVLDIYRSGTLSRLVEGSIGSTDTAVKSTRFHYAISAAAHSKAEVAAGTALAAGTILSDDWGIYLFSIDASGTITSTAGAGNFDGSYANEAAAIAGLPATPGSEYAMFYVTVQTNSGNAFVGGTDGLQGGSSGNVSNETNYVTLADAQITLSVSVDPGTGAVVGFNLVELDDVSSKIGFAGGDEVYVTVEAGTVNSNSAVGLMLAHFSVAGDGLTTQQKSDVQTKADDALVARDLDKLINQAESDTPVDNSIMAKLASATADWSTHVPSTDSLEAIRNAAALEATLGAPAGADLAADIAALKAETVLIVEDTNELQADDIPGTLSTMDAKLDTIDNFLDTEIAAILAAVDTEIAALVTAIITNAAGVDIAADIVALQTDLDNATDGLGALKALIDALPQDKTGYSLSTAGILAVWHQALAQIATAGSIGKLLKDEITAVRMAVLTEWINGGRLDAILDLVALEATVAGLNDLSAAQVNAEVVDVLKTDTVTLPGQAAPPLTPTMEEMFAWQYKMMRNRKKEDATSFKLYADDEATVDAKATISDDGTDAIVQEMVAGP